MDKSIRKKAPELLAAYDQQGHRLAMPVLWDSVPENVALLSVIAILVNDKHQVLITRKSRA